MRQKLLLLLLALFAVVPNTFSQVEDDDETEEPLSEADFPQPTTKVNKYFDDGRTTFASNALKLDLTGLLGSNLAIAYERKLANFVSLELTAGLVLYNGLNMNTVVTGDFRKVNPIKSPILGGMVRFYFNQGGIDLGSYMGGGILHRTYALQFESEGDSAVNVSMNSFRFQQGGQYMIGKNVAIEIGYFAGIAVFNTKEGKIPDSWVSINNDFGVFWKMGFFF
jgi:hypothetical protein